MVGEQAKVFPKFEKSLLWNGVARWSDYWDFEKSIWTIEKSLVSSNFGFGIEKIQIANKKLKLLKVVFDFVFFTD